jgi:hypothetical protein
MKVLRDEFSQFEVGGQIPGRFPTTFYRGKVTDYKRETNIFRVRMQHVCSPAVRSLSLDLSTFEILPSEDIYLYSGGFRKGL